MKWANLWKKQWPNEFSANDIFLAISLKYRVFVLIMLGFIAKLKGKTDWQMVKNN